MDAASPAHLQSFVESSRTSHASPNSPMPVVSCTCEVSVEGAPHCWIGGAPFAALTRFASFADHPDHVSELAMLFQERPAWSQASLSEKLPDCPAHILQQLLLNQGCYVFRNGEPCCSFSALPASRVILYHLSIIQDTVPGLLFASTLATFMDSMRSYGVNDVGASTCQIAPVPSRHAPKRRGSLVSCGQQDLAQI